MTVLFADLVESTRMIDGRDPEELMDGLAAYRMAIREAVERFGGFILHHLGDGVIVCFGYPIGNEDAAERAVRAASRSWRRWPSFPPGPWPCARASASRPASL